jgi:hypothetical protein
MSYVIENFSSSSRTVKWSPRIKSIFLYKNFRKFLYFRTYYQPSFIRFNKPLGDSLIIEKLIQTFYFRTHIEKHGVWSDPRLFGVKNNFLKSLLYLTFWEISPQQPYLEKFSAKCKAKINVVSYYTNLKTLKTSSKGARGKELIIFHQRTLLLNWVQVNSYVSFYLRESYLIREDLLLRHLNLYFFKIYNR